MREVTAYLIDPFARTVTEVKHDADDYTGIYKFIDADCFDVARVNNEGDGIFVDDEGLINGKPQEFFVIKGYPTPLAGKGLVLGCDEEGDTIAPRGYTSVEQLRSDVTFLSYITAGIFITEHGSLVAVE